MLFEIFLFVIASNIIQCALVLDAEYQKGLHLSDYCPKMKYCPEGAHIMCMYYDLRNVMGPKCRDARNVTMTSALANKLVDVTNALRSRVSRGQEKGKNQERLPRGYGIFRLRWDSELATFAQVLANQCVLRHDLCRATKKFPDPGQTASVVRFKGPDWLPTSKRVKLLTTGLNEEKLLYAVTQSLKTWYSQKSSVTIQMVTNYPDWTKDATNQQSHLYLTMIYGSATHMGCGISAYSDYVYYEKHSEFYNTVLVICNFSAQPRPGAAVYNTVPPTDTESSFNACGCPIGSLEDDDCLCLEVPRVLETSMVVSHKNKPCPVGLNCDPTVVLLPIFTMEDAPPDKLVTQQRVGNASMSRTIHETENTLDSFEELFGNNLSENKGILRKSRKTLDLQPQGNSNGKRQRSLLHSNGVTVRNRHFDKPNEAIDHKDSNHHDNKKPHKQSQGHSQRSSVFTKTPIFELPGSHYFLSSIKRDVVPRKDFFTGKQLVNKYLNNKNSMILPKEIRKFDHSVENTVNNAKEAKSVETVRLSNDFHTYVQPKEHNGNIENHEELHFHDILTTETVLNTAEQNVMNHKDSNELNISLEFDKSEANTATEENDIKFMALLDTLEQEVKHIELRDKEKQIFDAKIKKIYGKVVGKPSYAMIDSEKNHFDQENNNKNHDNAQKTEDDDDYVHKLPPSYDAKGDDSTFIEMNYQSKHNADTETDDKYPKTDMTDVETDGIERFKDNIQKPLSDYGSRDKYYSRRNRNFRHKSRNYLSSREFLRDKYDNGFKGRKTYRNSYKNDFGKLQHRSNSLDYKREKNYYTNDVYEDILSFERRKYYQDRLDSMERKLRDARRYNRRKDAERSPHMRAMKSNFRSDNQINPLYTGRARILHGY